jgi:hypothetical protein
VILRREKALDLVVFEIDMIVGSEELRVPALRVLQAQRLSLNKSSVRGKRNDDLVLIPKCIYYFPYRMKTLRDKDIEDHD